MPIYVAQTVKTKGPSGVPPLGTMAILSALHATVYPWLHSLPPCTLGRVPERHVVGELERGYRVAACRDKYLAAAVAFPRPGTCRSPGPAGTRGVRRQVL